MFTIAWFSCERSSTTNAAIQRIADVIAPTVCFSLGDTPYTNFGPDGWGYSLSNVDVQSTVQDFEDHYNQMLAKPCWKSLLSSVRDKYMMGDDHEWGGDNWDHTLTHANDKTGIGAVTQMDVDNHFNMGNQAAINITSSYFQNPTNIDAEAIAEKPSEADASTPTSNYPVKYFRVGYDLDGAIDNASPTIECFMLDCISYRSPLADVDDASKTMLGANQKAWLKARLLSSTATFKLIVSPKKTYKSSTGDNGDTFGEYSTERDEIVNYITTNSIDGVLWIAGDKHRPHVINSDTHCCVVACPVGVAVNSELTLDNNIVAQWDDQNFGVVHVYQDKLIIRIENTFGSTLWSGELLAGKNTITYPSLVAAI